MAVNFARIWRPRPKALVAARARPLWDRKRSSFACHSKVAEWNWRWAQSQPILTVGRCEAKPVMAKKVKEVAFDPMVFLATVDGGRTISKYQKNETIFWQKERSRSPSFPSMGRKPLLRFSDRTNFAARDA